MHWTDRLEILIERAQDTELQRRAALLYRALVKALDKPIEAVLMRSRQTGHMVFRIRPFGRVSGVRDARHLALDVPVRHDQTSLWPLERPEGITRYVLTWRPTIVYLPRGTTSLGQVSIRELRELLSRAVVQDREKLMHELTHFIDIVRLGKERWRAADRGYKTDTEDLERYANHPIELNAYYQQIAAAEREDFDIALNGDDPVWDLWQWADFDVKEAVGRFTSKIQRHIWQQMTEKNKRRFRKRAAMFYDEIRQQAREKLHELAADGDEDAQYALADMS